MSDASVFGFVCEQVEHATSLSQLEARGTVRLALKAAGIDAKVVSPEQMKVVLGKVMPRELESRGCENPERLCQDIADRMAGRSFAAAGASDSPEAVFARLGGA
ncbi:MAG: hypothetical protein MUF70_12425 [Myxococcota bacterium]|nr:hypothetical protein [Myxococcota bacterium]